MSPEEFLGIVESDDLFFTYSEKGNHNLGRQLRKRGAKGSTAGISEEKVAAIATCGCTGNKDFKVATKGRISKENLDTALLGKIDKAAVLCSNSHRSYIAFAKSKDFEDQKIQCFKRAARRR